MMGAKPTDDMPGLVVHKEEEKPIVIVTILDGWISLESSQAFKETAPVSDSSSLCPARSPTSLISSEPLSHVWISIKSIIHSLHHPSYERLIYVKR